MAISAIPLPAARGHRLRLVLAAIIIAILMTIIGAQAMWRVIVPREAKEPPEIKPYHGPVILPQPGVPAAAAAPQAAPEPKTSPPPPPPVKKATLPRERLGDVALRMEPVEVRPPEYRDGRRVKLGEGCALRPGSSMEIALETRVNTEQGGPVVARVVSPVLSPDPGYRNKVLVPAGAQLTGEVRKDGSLTLQDRRAPIVWTQLTSPVGFGGDSSVNTVDLGHALGSDASGQAGMGGDVEMRWGNAIMAGVLTTVFNVGQRGALPNSNAQIDAYQREVSGTLGQFGNQVLEKTLPWEPVITIEAGTLGRLYINETLRLC
ncbi:MAG: TrbI/VirB10 family protein [Bradyrhizobiaceae bacterium]|nr:TrbI/VirB10 family protein [Bradyrhizobiaceae bacterium]